LKKKYEEEQAKKMSEIVKEMEETQKMSEELKK
jgi:hypothetical protein